MSARIDEERIGFQVNQDKREARALQRGGSVLQRATSIAAASSLAFAPSHAAQYAIAVFTATPVEQRSVRFDDRTGTLSSPTKRQSQPASPETGPCFRQWTLRLGMADDAASAWSGVLPGTIS